MGQLMNEWSRREFLYTGLVATAGLMLPGNTLASCLPSSKGDKSLSFYNTHTGESLNKLVFWSDGKFVHENLDQVNYLLRDFRTGDIHKIDPDLLVLLYSLSRKVDTKHAIHIISGYRSPKTNAALAKASHGVAKHSLHMQGMAIDIRIPGRELKVVRQAALNLRKGGVGYYPSSAFVHVDTGRPRCWQG